MTINPEKLTAQHIARILSIPSALDATIFFKGRIQMISLKVKEKNYLEGITIANLNKKLKERIIVCAIERDNKIIIPRGTTKIQIKDILHITGTPKNIIEFLKLVDLDDKTRKVIISGGGATSVYLAKYLDEMGMATKIIEINEERSNFLSEKLPNTLVINGDASDQALNASFTTFGNVGLCFDISNFANFSNFSKSVLSIGMLLGRLEIFPIIVWLSTLRKKSSF